MTLRRCSRPSSCSPLLAAGQSAVAVARAVPFASGSSLSSSSPSSSSPSSSSPSSSVVFSPTSRQDRSYLTAIPRHRLRLKESAPAAAEYAFASGRFLITSTPARDGSSDPSSLSSSGPSAENLSIEDYHAVSESTLDSLLTTLEYLVEESEAGTEQDWEVEYSQGVMTFKAPPRGTYVINKQPPNKQIWVSSPTSGPKRFDYSPSANHWVCHRDGQIYLLHELLDAEWSEAAGQEVRVLQGIRGGSQGMGERNYRV